MSVNGKTKVFGLLGNPIEHTLSPYIHQLFYDELDYNGVYNPFFVPEGMIQEAIKGMKGLNIEGLNITVPNKESVIQELDDIDPITEIIGACNTIVRTKNGLKGYNTDWIGLQMDCAFNQVSIRGKDCVIIGAGGAARGVVAFCCMEKAHSITVLNRTVERGSQLKEIVEMVNPNLLFKCGSLEDLHLVEEGSIAFQTTTIGMYPNVQECPINNDEFYAKVDFAVDIIYNPKETLFMKKLGVYGVKSINGLGMLFFQALKAFELWTGEELNNIQIEQCMLKLKKKVYELD